MNDATEQTPLERAWQEATGEPLSQVMGVDGKLPTYLNFGLLEKLFLAAEHNGRVGASEIVVSDDGVGIDVVLSDLERIAEVAEDADRPLHRNEMRVDWAQSLGAGERRYVLGLRGTLSECARLAREAIQRGKDSCSCERQPGTDPGCPVHQLAADEQS